MEFKHIEYFIEINSGKITNIKNVSVGINGVNPKFCIPFVEYINSNKEGIFVEVATSCAKIINGFSYVFVEDNKLVVINK